MFWQLLVLSAASNAQNAARVAAERADTPPSESIPIFITLSELKVEEGLFSDKAVEAGSETISVSAIKFMKQIDLHGVSCTKIKFYGGYRGFYKETPDQIEKLVNKKIADMAALIWKK